MAARILVGPTLEQLRDAVGEIGHKPFDERTVFKMIAYNGVEDDPESDKEEQCRLSIKVLGYSQCVPLGSALSDHQFIESLRESVRYVRVDCVVLTPGIPEFLHLPGIRCWLLCDTVSGGISLTY